MSNLILQLFLSPKPSHSNNNKTIIIICWRYIKSGILKLKTLSHLKVLAQFIEICWSSIIARCKIVWLDIHMSPYEKLDPNKIKIFTLHLKIFIKLIKIYCGWLSTIVRYFMHTSVTRYTHKPRTGNRDLKFKISRSPVIF